MIDSQMYSYCVSIQTNEKMCGSYWDPGFDELNIVLFLMNFDELLNCWKILFACLLYYIVSVLLFESIGIILRYIVFV